MRSVPAQEKPYPQLVEVTKNQPEFEFNDVKGTIAGFRCPSYVKGINVAGYHLHFLTEDKTGGGHVLEFSLIEGILALDYTSDFYLVLPREKGAFFSTDLSKEREEELKEVEK